MQNQINSRISDMLRQEDNLILSVLKSMGYVWDDDNAKEELFQIFGEDRIVITSQRFDITQWGTLDKTVLLDGYEILRYLIDIEGITILKNTTNRGP